MARTTFASLANRNYRLYLGGQLVSLAGTWMQGVAQAWLVLQLTGSGTALGVVTALQFLPVLLLGPLGGVVADRVDKRKLLVATQVASGLLALGLGLLAATGAVRLWHVWVLALGLGVVTLLDNPARQSFVLEMVGPDHLSNAVSLNSVTVNLARVVGPAVAGVLISVVGVATCFLLNAASYVAVIVALLAMRVADLHPAPPQRRAKGQVREGFRYVRRTPELLVPLIVMAVVGTLGYEFQVSLPLLAKTTFHGGAGTYSLMTCGMGLGAVVGGLVTASLGKPRRGALVTTSLLFGVLILAVAASPTLPVAIVAITVMGGCSIAFLAIGNATLQLRTDPTMRGRVMALWAIAFLGSTPVGGPIVGWVGQHVGPRWAVGLGGVATLLAGAFGWWRLRRLPGGLADVPGAVGRTEAEVLAERAAVVAGLAEVAVQPADGVAEEAEASRAGAGVPGVGSRA